MLELIARTCTGYEQAVIVYFFVLTGIYYLLMAAGFFEILRHRALDQDEDSDVMSTSPLVLPISVLAPAYNEAAGIRECVRSLLAISYAEFEVIVINDGSKDDTLRVLIEEFALYRSCRYFDEPLATKAIRGVYESMHPIRLVVVDKENGGKADAVNAGINVARYPLVCAIDTDSLLDKDALTRVARPFLLDPDRVIAVGGIVRIANGCGTEKGRVTRVDLPKSWLARFQVVEYLRAFLGGRLAFSAANCLMVISGAFGLFRRSAVLACGGFKHGSMGEDMELVVRLHRWARDRKMDYRIVFQPDPVCWTEAPESLSVLKSQRKRWQWGTLETLWAHKGMLLRPRYGMAGCFALPYFLVFEGFGPVIELLGYLVTIAGCSMGFVDWKLGALFFVGAVLNGMVLSAISVGLSELTTRRYPRIRSLLILFCAAMLENLGYRQLQTVWRAWAFVCLLAGRKEWGTMIRKGFTTQTAPPAPAPATQS
jgi:cellulose synthase/poly-beta-1,6-N-acetylglucosamine synthase-like glycosyltransferase